MQPAHTLAQHGRLCGKGAEGVHTKPYGVHRSGTQEHELGALFYHCALWYSLPGCTCIVVGHLWGTQMRLECKALACTRFTLHHTGLSIALPAWIQASDCVPRQVSLVLVQFRRADKSEACCCAGVMDSGLEEDIRAALEQHQRLYDEEQQAAAAALAASEAGLKDRAAYQDELRMALLLERRQLCDYLAILDHQRLELLRRKQAGEQDVASAACASS